MITIATQCFPPIVGGIENMMFALATALQRAGRNVHVFADVSTRNDAEFDRVQPFPVCRHGGLKPLRRWRKARAITRQAASSGRNGVLLTDSWKSLELVDRNHFSRVVCLVHGTEIPVQPSAAKLRRLHNSFAKADYIIANSNYTAGRVRPWLPEPDKLRVILPGIAAPVAADRADVEVRKQLGGRHPVLITLARLEPRKGHLAVLQVVSRLVREFPDILYIIAGEGSHRTTIESAVNDAGLHAHVRFLGQIQDPEKSAWLKNSTLYIMPGITTGQDVEGFGLAYIDAALQGLPAIASDSGGAPEAVLHQQTGLVCPSGNETQLLQLTRELLQNRSLLEQLGLNAKLRAEGFVWDKKIIEYLSLLE
jgi:phosphatidylinositol alpha-1,6-mannosyltransferase